MIDYSAAENIISKIKGHYRSGTSSLADDFFVPCIKYCTTYLRAVGFFSSSSLISWLDILPKFSSKEPLSIKMLISPYLSLDDKKALEKVFDEDEKALIQANILELLVNNSLRTLLSSNDTKIRLDLFAWMIINDYLELKFAFPKHVHHPGLFHEKIGIFEFPWNKKIAFTGSANESGSAYSQNYESIDVYRSWISSDFDRVIIKEQQFYEAWEGRAIGLSVRKLSNKILEHIKELAPREKPSVQTKIPSDNYTGYEKESRWRHQDEAVREFLKVCNGVLEMATGTGKTRTAIKIIEKLFCMNEIEGVIIATTGTDLLDQWDKEIGLWSLNHQIPYRILRHYEKYHELLGFVLNSNNAILIISREQLSSLFRLLPENKKSKLMVVHDEVHGLGSPSSVVELAAMHKSFIYRLGLSATPEREYDQEGNLFINSEIGKVFYKFDLKDAIERGILCEFDYVPLRYQLTENDRKRIQQVYTKKAARAKNGNPMTDEEVWIEISKVYKTAEMKPSVFREYLMNNPYLIMSAIIFVETKEYGKQILEIIHPHTNLYRTYYAEDDRDNLKSFSRGEIECLVTCHRISQGIDIKKIRNIIIFSSARSKLETIQRIGRCLRIDPDDPLKRAVIVDFVLDNAEQSEHGTDNERLLWLTELSKVRRK